MPEIFNKTGYGLTDFLGIAILISALCQSGSEGPPLWLGLLLE